MNNAKSMEITPSKRFFNYLQISDAVKATDPEISFFIKAYAFKQAYDLISSNKASQDTFHNFSSLYGVFKNEVSAYDESKMTKELFAKFLEKHYSKLEFKTLDVLYNSRDLLDIMHSFGPFDELTTRRMEYFNKKIALLSAGKSKIIGLNKNYSLPISTKAKDYQSYQNEIIQLIEKSNNDIDADDFDQSIEKLESALHYLLNIKNE